MTVRGRVLRGGVVLVIYVGFMIYNNPIRFHQTAHAGGLTMQVPFTWTPMKIPGNIFSVSLRREWSPYLQWGTVSVSSRGSGSWTMEAARKIQVGDVAYKSKVAFYSNTSAFDLKAGDRTAVCSESTFGDKSRTLNCTIVDTPLQLYFSGSRSAELDAERMLASLN